jgi:uncharacterized membrane protein YoaK (UPF0700 family)
MFAHSLSKGATRTAVFHWFLLAFLSGSVNVGGYLACNRFVTHMTGFATLFGMHAGEGRWDAAVGIISIPAFFLLGVMISAYLIDRPFRRGGNPHYTLVMLLVTVCLASAALLGYFGYFGSFGEEVRLKRDYFFLALLCAASGLQNAAITTASGATVRTTHLTGLTTDLGIGIVRGWSVPSTPEGRVHAELEWQWTRFRLGTWGSFAMGGAVGAVIYMSYQYLGFLMPAALAFYAMCVSAISLHHRPSVSAHSRHLSPSQHADSGTPEEKIRV